MRIRVFAGLLACPGILVGKDASATGSAAKPDANGIVEFVRYGTADKTSEGDLYLPKKVSAENVYMGRTDGSRR